MDEKNNYVKINNSSKLLLLLFIFASDGFSALFIGYYNFARIPPEDGELTIIMLKEYKTLLKPAVAQYEEKKSKFIASVKPVATEEDALEFINDLKSKYWDATHNVYAYSLCGNNIIQRYSDDGEPSGTAGLPVMEVIKRTGLQNVVVVVTRYFGGTLLGAAGLIRAYGKGATLGIEAAGIVIKQQCVEVKLTLEYFLLGKVQNLILTHGFITKDTVYGQDVEIYLLVPPEEIDRLGKLLDEATRASVLLEMGDKKYITVSEDGKLIEC